MLKNRFEGKVAIVTASTDGIGYAIAKRLAQEGASVVVSSRKQANVDRAVKALCKDGLKISGIVCHVASQTDRNNLYQKALSDFGGIDILVSNAGICPYFGDFLETPEDAWDRTFEVNVKATFLLCREVVPFMRKRGGGSILIVSSVAAYVPNPLIGVYSITKTTLLGLKTVLAKVCMPYNIRVNCLAPGLIDTRFSSAIKNDEVIKDIPMKRMGTADECAGAAAFLVSSEASYMSSETVGVTGGILCRL